MFLVLVAAKAAGLWGHHLSLSPWAPIAYTWHDAAVALAFAALEGWLQRLSLRFVHLQADFAGPARAGHDVDMKCALAWAGYAILAGYVALNIPVVRVLSTPLTAAMWKATSGTIADSIWLYATWSNVLLILLVSGIACLAPRVTAAVSRAQIVAPLAVCAALGPLAAPRVDTEGLERNAWTALATSIIPRVSAHAAVREWRADGFDRVKRDDLSRFRGAASGRNVVVVSLESTAARYLGLYGATPDVMPNLSALARDAIVFDSAYAVYPESIKGLFSILCSTYPSFDVPTGAYASVACPSLATMLADRGYRTALFHSGRFMYLGMEAVVRNRGYQTLEDAGDIGGHRQSSFGVDEPATVARMLAWIDRLPPSRPFFVTYLPIAGHHPYDTPEPGPFPEHSEFDRYRNALGYSDAALGDLVRGLASRGHERDTVWIVFGDHGEAFGQHDGNFGHTFQLYEENVRVPLIVAAPGSIHEQTRVPRVVSLIDIAATTMDLVAAGPRSIGQGRSMLDDYPRMALFFADYSLGMLGLRDGPAKFIYELDSRRAKLFDLTHDPDERVNFAADRPSATRRYEQLLRGWSTAQKAALRASLAP